MFDAVIFDWDGTLADTKKVILFAFHKALKEVGVDGNDAFIERRIGTGAAETFREILKDKGVAFDEALIVHLVAAKVQAEIDVTGEAQLFKGARELLEALAGKVRLGLASMNNRAVINHMINELKVTPFFETIVTADEVSRPKPDPEIFLKAADRLQSQTKKCVVIEDSIFGVRAAKAANMSCVAVLTGAYPTKELAKAKPDLIVSSLSEKGALLKFIFA